MKKLAGVGLVIFCLLILVGLPYIVYLNQQSKINYQENGKDVTATVISVEKHRTRKSWITTVQVVYENEDGEAITAQAINPGNVRVDDTIVGRVVPENPEEVYLEPPVWQVVLIYGVGGLLYVGALVLLIAIFNQLKTDKQMAKRGKVTEATIIGRQIVGDGELFVDVEFEDENGVLRRGYCRATEYMDTDKSTCTIRYIPKSKNKAICEMSL